MTNSCSANGSCDRNRPSARAKSAQILAAARRIFLEHGFSAATTDMIQREAGVSKSTVYAHFPTKVELFQEVIRAECGCFMEGLVTEAIPQADVRTTLVAIGVRFLDLLLSPTALAFHRIIVAEASRFPSLGRTFYASGPTRLHQRLGVVLANAGSRGELAIADPAAAVEQLLGMLRGDRHLRCLIGLEEKPAESEIRAAAEQAVDRFLRAYAST